MLPEENPIKNMKRPVRGPRHLPVATLLAGACLLVLSTSSHAVPAPAPLAALANDPVVKGHTAYQRRDRSQLMALRNQAQATAHPLAMWTDYWELSNRLRQARQPEVDAFFARWPGTTVEDQLRKEWILELGKRRDWSRIAVEAPRVRVNDQREVACYGLLVRQQAGENVTAQARELWFAQREADHGCAQLAAALYHARQLTREDAWARSRVAAEQNRRFVAQHATGMLGRVSAETVRQVFLHPAAFLAKRSATPSPDEAELMALAIIRTASRSPQVAADILSGKRGSQLSPAALATAWAVVGKQAAIKLNPQALAWFQKGSAVPGAGRLDLSDDVLEWKVRSALRVESTPSRWQQIIEAVDAMSPAQRYEPTWMYWKARALKATAVAGTEGDARRGEATQLLEATATRLHFYSKFAADELGRAVRVPPRPAPPTEAERAAALNNASLTRALALIDMKLREEALDEWNHGINGQDDRGLLASAQRACDAEVWNRCMSTSERTKTEIDLVQRFPMPFRDHVEVAAREADIDAGYVYSVIRQESHFSVGVRSVVGASGLMQVMPHTAHWTARKFRIPFKPGQITDPATNLRIGARYLKTVLEAFDGSQAHAAAAYNAGPGRPRRWRNNPAEDVAAWIEIIPLDETREYVKGVLSNATYYGALLNGSVSGAKPGVVERRAGGSGEGLLATAVGR
jgi:soluble lytic murein transglycosylase